MNNRLLFSKKTLYAIPITIFMLLLLIFLFPSQLSLSEIDFCSSGAYSNIDDHFFEQKLQKIYNDNVSSLEKYGVAVSGLHNGPSNGNDLVFHFEKVPSLYVLRLQLLRLCGVDAYYKAM